MKHPADFLPRTFFGRTPLQCAMDLTGSFFVWQGRLARVVETEAYDAVGDPACHTWTRPSARQFVEEHPPGTAYVYLNYGMHWLFNILIKGGRRSGFVLIRAVEPVNFAKDHPQGLRAGAGPGKAARLMGIDGSVHGMDLCQPGVQSGFWTQPERWGSVVRTPRIGISRGQDLLWRFCLKNHPSVSGPRFPLVRSHKSG